MHDQHSYACAGGVPSSEVSSYARSRTPGISRRCTGCRTYTDCDAAPRWSCFDWPAVATGPQFSLHSGTVNPRALRRRA